jgi:hypothetical protein
VRLLPILLLAHKKATPEQIRRFNDLEKKQRK